MRGWIGSAVVAAAGGAWAADMVLQSAREIPVLREVDVVVVGGSCGAVAAAESAARSGAKVFLVTPRLYLGEDIAGTMRLWLDGDERPTTPLAKAIYGEPSATASFTYVADLKSSAKHADPGDRLADGRWADAPSESVQYDGDVTITADLGSVREIRGVSVYAFRRAGEFDIASVALATGADGTNWTDGPILTTATETGAPEGIVFRSGLRVRGRHVRFTFARPAGLSRLLLGELVIDTPPAASDARAPLLTTPLRAKRALDQALLDAKVPVLTGCFPTEILRDAAGRPAGVVVANRSGRQAVLARAIIDATERAAVARLAGARFRPYPEGLQTFSRMVIAGEPPAADHMTVQERPGRYDVKTSGSPRGAEGAASVDGRAFECVLRIPMKDGSFASFAEAEQIARDRTFVATTLDAAETLFQVPPDPVTGEAALSAASWPGADAADPRWFRPAGVPGLFILGGCADLPRDAAAQLLRPPTLMEVGARLGAAAAAEAKSAPAPKAVRVASTALAAAPADVREFLGGIPSAPSPARIPSPAQALPVLGEFDVVVVGGGTGGAPAGIGAGRYKARALVLEQQHVLGGVGTIGMIGKYYFGNICGFTREHDAGVAAMKAAVHVVGKAEWWRRENREAGTTLWLGAIGCGAVVEDGRVTGVIVATPDGRGVVRARTVIDATGNSDVAAAAGAETEFIADIEPAVQGAGQSPRRLGASYLNSDFGFVNDSDVADLAFFALRARLGSEGPWDLSALANTRERRRVVGDLTVSPLDIVNQRTYPDTIFQARSNFDSHGYTVHPAWFLVDPGHHAMTANVPYRCMLPRGLDGLLVIGLGMSAHRDAIPLLRMQPDVQNQGYAVGIAGALAARDQRTIRQVDIKELQRRLVEERILPAEVLEAKDSYPIAAERLAEAVKNLADRYKDFGVVLADPPRSLPLLRQALATAEMPEARRIYAQTLGLLGDPTGVPVLVEAVDAAAGWDTGWNFRGMGQFGRSVSDIDSYIIALGRSRDPRALAPILKKAELLDAQQPFSHFRSVALGLEALGDRRAAPALASVLKKEGVAGHALAGVTDLQPLKGNSEAAGNQERARCLKEISLARALYRCGDAEGLGEKILRQYAADPRGVYAIHAAAVLTTGSEKKSP